jgi:undecaprenyl pyrophosphate phosphatase UppP
MSIPAILGASVFKFADFVRAEEKITGAGAAQGIIGFVFAFIFGMLAIAFIHMIARRKNFFTWFAVYCFAAGLVALIWG